MELLAGKWASLVCGAPCIPGHCRAGWFEHKPTRARFKNRWRAAGDRCSLGACSSNLCAQLRRSVVLTQLSACQRLFVWIRRCGLRGCVQSLFSFLGKKIAPETGIYRTEGAGGGRWLSEHSIRGSDCCVWLRWRVPV